MNGTSRSLAASAKDWSLEEEEQARSTTVSAREARSTKARVALERPQTERLSPRLPPPSHGTGWKDGGGERGATRARPAPRMAWLRRGTFTSRRRQLGSSRRSPMDGRKKKWLMKNHFTLSPWIVANAVQALSPPLWLEIKKKEALAHRATRSGLMEQRKQTTEQVPMGCIASHPRPEKLWE